MITELLSYDIAPRESFNITLHTIYAAAEQVRRGAAPRGQFVVHPHSVALLFAILGTGCIYNLSLDVNDAVAEGYLLQSQRCLALGDFMSKNTITAIQALVRGLHYKLTARISWVSVTFPAISEATRHGLSGDCRCV
jgi:hypothetical protein